MVEFRGAATAEQAFEIHEHHGLAPGIARIHAAARASGIGPADWSKAVLDVVDWVDTVLQPHAAWEDGWLYPEIARRAGTPWATALMTFEHSQILEIARKLEADRELLGNEPDRAATDLLRGHLIALETLLLAHLEREERFLIPILETTAAEAVTGARSS